MWGHPFPKIMAGYEKFCCVAGGWAIDFYLNRQTRPHEDIELVVLREDYRELYQHFAALRPRKIVSGETSKFIDWDGQPIEQNIIQIRLDSIKKAAQSFEFDLLLSPSNKGEWICRRDINIRLPLSQVARLTPMGVPVLAPEIVLLFKAKYLREKDRLDFKNVQETLNDMSRNWLLKSLQSVHPNHEWQSSL